MRLFYGVSHIALSDNQSLVASVGVSSLVWKSPEYNFMLWDNISDVQVQHLRSIPGLENQCSFVY